LVGVFFVVVVSFLTTGFLAGVFFVVVVSFLTTGFLADIFSDFVSTFSFLVSLIFVFISSFLVSSFFVSLSEVKNSACLYLDKALIVAKALFNLLFDHIIFDKIFSYPAKSKTDLTEDQALSPVP
jgi:hypothetical protein